MPEAENGGSRNKAYAGFSKSESTGILTFSSSPICSFGASMMNSRSAACFWMAGHSWWSFMSLYKAIHCCSFPTAYKSNDVRNKSRMVVYRTNAMQCNVILHDMIQLYTIGMATQTSIANKTINAYYT